jgi:signal transduction histidine kinase
VAGTETSAPSAASRPLRTFWRALAITIAGLWLLFLTNLGLTIAQQLGQSLGVPLIQIAPQVLTWALHQPLAVQICLAAFALYLTAAIAWVSVWLWRLKTQAQLKDEEAALAAQTAAYSEATRERDEALAEKVSHADAQAAVIKEEVGTARSEAAEYADESKERDTAIAGKVEQTRAAVVAGTEIILSALVSHRAEFVLARDLKAVTLAMGDNRAATFRYNVDAVRDSFPVATQTL